MPLPSQAPFPRPSLRGLLEAVLSPSCCACPASTKATQYHVVPNAEILWRDFHTVLGTMVHQKSLLYKASENFSTASGENSVPDGANSRQNRVVSVVPRDASVVLMESTHPSLRSIFTSTVRAGASILDLEAVYFLFARGTRRQGQCRHKFCCYGCSGDLVILTVDRIRSYLTTWILLLENRYHPGS
jgi:hypothetical protein